MESSSILSLLWQRSEDGLLALAKTYGPRLYHTAMNILSNHQDAEECVDDTYLAVWNAIPPKRPEPLCGFVLKTGRNIALNRLRNSHADKRDSSMDISLDELAACIPGSSLEDELDARTLGNAIDRFLDTVSKESRFLFLRRYWFGDSIREIAQASGLKENTVTVRLSRIREKLKLYLSEEGLFDA